MGLQVICHFNIKSKTKRKYKINKQHFVIREREREKAAENASNRIRPEAEISWVHS